MVSIKIGSKHTPWRMTAIQFILWTCSCKIAYVQSHSFHHKCNSKRLEILYLSIRRVHSYNRMQCSCQMHSKEKKNCEKFSLHEYGNNLQKERITYRVNYCPYKKFVCQRNKYMPKTSLGRCTKNGLVIVAAALRTVGWHWEEQETGMKQKF